MGNDRLKLLIKDILCSSSISEDDIETGFSNSKFLLFSSASFANLNLDSGGVAIIIPSISGDLTKSSQLWKKFNPVSFSKIDFFNVGKNVFSIVFQNVWSNVITNGGLNGRPNGGLNGSPNGRLNGRLNGRPNGSPYCCPNRYLKW